MSVESKPPTTAPEPDLQDPPDLRDLENLFASVLAKMDVSVPLALAVSGGGDSIALMRLVSHWMRNKGLAENSIFVLTVDHGLRDGAADEAAQVASWAQALGFNHHTLHWRGIKPKSGLQEKAREARYGLMDDWCVAHGVCDLLLAHTASDQTETVGMRLLKGSGTRGLAGMQAATQMPLGSRLLRPLLGFDGGDLREMLRVQDVAWLEDPSNTNTSFERVRMRQALEGDAPLTQGLASLNDEAAKARQAMDAAVDDLFTDGAHLHRGPWVRLDRRVFQSAPKAIVASALSRMVLALGGALYQPALSAANDLATSLVEPDFKAATLGRCILARDGADHVVIGREARNVTSLSLTTGQEDMWDNRIWVRSDAAEAVRIRPLGELELSDFPEKMREAIKEVLPLPLRGSAMVVHFEGGNLALPLAGIGNWTGIEARFSGFPPFGPQILESAQSTGC